LNGDEENSIIQLAHQVGEMSGNLKGMAENLGKAVDAFNKHQPKCDARLLLFGPEGHPEKGVKYFLDQLREGKKYAIRLTWKQAVAILTALGGFAAYVDKDAVWAFVQGLLTH